DVVPAGLAQAGGVAQPALDLVGQDGGGDEVPAGGAGRLADGQHRGEVVAGVGRLQRQVGVVVVEVADEQAVDEGGPRDAAAAAPEQAGGALAPDAQGAASGAGVGVGAQGADGGGQRVDEAAAGLMDDRRGQVLEAQPAAVLGELAGQGHGAHGASSFGSVREAGGAAARSRPAR